MNRALKLNLAGVVPTPAARLFGPVPAVLSFVVVLSGLRKTFQGGLVGSRRQSRLGRVESVFSF